MTTITAAQEIAYLNQIASQSGVNPAEAKAAKGILAQLNSLPPAQRDAYLAQVLGIAPGSNMSLGQMDKAIDNALANYASAASSLTASSSDEDYACMTPDQAGALLAAAAIKNNFQREKDAQTTRDAAYKAAADTQKAQAGNLRSEASSMMSSAVASLVCTTVSSAISAVGAGLSLSASLNAADLNCKADTMKATGQLKDLGGVTLADVTKAASNADAYSKVYDKLSQSAASLTSAVGGIAKATGDATQKYLEAANADLGAQLSSNQQLADHLKTVAQNLHDHAQQMIQFLQNLQDAKNKQMAAAARA
jgi:hypothetical protein